VSWGWCDSQNMLCFFPPNPVQQYNHHKLGYKKHTSPGDIPRWPQSMLTRKQEQHAISARMRQN
jgi:hypothetical protein